MRGIEKASGGDRAIAATSTFYAVYGALKAPELEVWRSSRSGFWNSALKGSSSLRAAVERVMTAEVAAHTLGCPGASLGCPWGSLGCPKASP